VKQIDTVAGEYPAVTNYLYFTYHGSQNDVSVGSSVGDGVFSRVAVATIVVLVLHTCIILCCDVYCAALQIIARYCMITRILEMLPKYVSWV
jgi:hypothetical protein